MKSKFAKFIDGTLGACLIFFAATAVMRYFTPLRLAVFSATAITACAIIILKATGRKQEAQKKLSDAAENMFFDFMFMEERAPVKHLFAALKSKLPNAVMHGGGIYSGNNALFCAFSAPPDEKTSARLIAKAKHYGAAKITVLCKIPPQRTLDIENFKIKFVSGNDVYALFASLGALPISKYAKRQRTLKDSFTGALGKDKIVRYAVLAAAMFAITLINGHSIITFLCACVCATLFTAAIIVNIGKAVKAKRKE
ncbi:MAG: hypothetical protein J1G01_03910 [Clostridiales bacterium]|nr:hypothetical protein [Clostridiales bacterium]